QTWNEAKSSYDEYSSTIDDTFARYEELRKGTAANGENLLLSDSEYAEYKSLVSEILGMGGDVQAYYNSNGEAIALETNALEKLNAARKEELETARRNYLNSGDDIFETYRNKIGEQWQD